MKVRCRFGLRLGWPITNAATFVIYVPEDRVNQFDEIVSALRGVLVQSGRTDIAARVIFERS